MLKSRERFLRLSATSHAPTDQARRAALALALPLASRAKLAGAPAKRGIGASAAVDRAS